MYNRCPNDLFGYCGKEPDFDEAPYEASIKGKDGVVRSTLYGGHCKLDPRTCGAYLTQTQLSEVINARGDKSKKRQAVGKSKASQRH